MKFAKKFVCGIFLLTASTALVVRNVAQDHRGYVSIRYIDPSCREKPIKGVRVRVTGQHYSKKLRTKPDGTFELKLTPGIYMIFAEKYGFKKLNILNVNINKGSDQKLTFKMERGYATNDATPSSPDYDPCLHEDRKPVSNFHVP